MNGFAQKRTLGDHKEREIAQKGSQGDHKAMPPAQKGAQSDHQARPPAQKGTQSDHKERPPAQKGTPNDHQARHPALIQYDPSANHCEIIESTTQNGREIAFTHSEGILQNEVCLRLFYKKIKNMT